MDHFFQFISLFLVALTANFFSALAGGGAGLVQLPALLLLGLPFHVGLATHKIASVALGVGATYRYLREYSLDKQIVFVILLFGLPGVFLGARTVIFLSQDVLNLFLGFLTIGLGIYSFLNKQFGLRDQLCKYTYKQLIVAGLVMFLIGFLNGSLSSGSGLFVTIWLVFWFRLDYSLAVAYTLVFVGLVWNGIGALTLSLHSSIAWNWLPPLLIGSLSGGYLGSHVAIWKGSRLVKKSFELLTLTVGMSLLLKTFYSF